MGIGVYWLSLSVASMRSRMGEVCRVYGSEFYSPDVFVFLRCVYDVCLFSFREAL